MTCTDKRRCVWRATNEWRVRLLNVDNLRDFANRAAGEIAKNEYKTYLSPQRLMKNELQFNSLSLDSIGFDNSAELLKVPDDKRGIYAFAICHMSDVLPPHGYILYIGIAGHDSKRSLRDRYKDYLNERTVQKRDRIARMIGTWYEVLRFYFAPVGDDLSSDDLKKIERQLNTALLPPFSVGDIDADVKSQLRAYR